MKKSYHSMVVPIVAAITALRSCALCSAGDSASDVIVVMRFLREPTRRVTRWRETRLPSSLHFSERLARLGRANRRGDRGRWAVRAALDRRAMPSRVGVSALLIAGLMIAGLASVAAPAAAVAQDLGVPSRHAGATALSPRPGTADTAVPGEGLAEDEVDARIGWLLATYIGAVRAALRRDNPRQTQDEMARVRAALGSLEQRLATGAHRLVLPVDLSASIAAAADAL